MIRSALPSVVLSAGWRCVCLEYAVFVLILLQYMTSSQPVLWGNSGHHKKGGISPQSKMESTRKRTHYFCTSCIAQGESARARQQKKGREHFNKRERNESKREHEKEMQKRYCIVQPHLMVLMKKMTKKP